MKTGDPGWMYGRFQDFKDDLEIEVGFTMDSGLGPSRVVKF